MCDKKLYNNVHKLYSGFRETKTYTTDITNGILLKLYTLNKTSTFSPEKYNASSSKFWGKTFCSYYVFSPKDI